MDPTDLMTVRARPGRSPSGARSEYLAGALWFLPALAVIASLIAGSLLSQVSVSKGSLLDTVAYQGNAADARQILIVVSATMITVTGLVFTLTVVAIQIASAQYSPRLLRNFLRDRGTQLVLSTFVATFTYSLAGLHTVGTRSTEGAFVPRLAISGSMALAFVSTAMLVYFIHHIANSIKIDSIMKEIERETLTVLDLTHPETATEAGDATSLPDPPPDAQEVRADHSGYVELIESGDLLGEAAAHELYITVVPMVGAHIVEGDVLARAWGSIPSSGDRARWVRAARSAVVIGAERTMQEDVRYGIRRLVDIAVRAISPAINDPYTAVQAIHHLTVILGAMAPRSVEDLTLLDQSGVARVGIPRPSFGDYLRLACAQIRRYGAREPAVLRALLTLLAKVSNRTADGVRHAAAAEEARLVLAYAQRAGCEAEEMAALSELADAIVAPRI